MKICKSPFVIIYLVLGCMTTTAALADTARSVNVGDNVNKSSVIETKAPLNLSIDQLPIDEPGMGSDVQLTENQRQIMDNLKPADIEAKSSASNGKNIDRDAVSIGGGVLTEDAESDDADALQAGKNYVDSIDGGKVDLKINF